jgi:hypothetical protein
VPGERSVDAGPQIRRAAELAASLAQSEADLDSVSCCGISMSPRNAEPRLSYSGVDWSGAVEAGRKVWRAELSGDGELVDLRQPWLGQGGVEFIRSVAAWIASMSEAWVAFDFPFGIALADQQALFGRRLDHPRKWSAVVAHAYDTPLTFVSALAALNLFGKHRRECDGDAPWPPLFRQLMYQTYCGHRLLHLLSQRVRLLPWDHAVTAAVSVVETCPATVLKRLGLDATRYKGAGTRRQRLILLEAVVRLEKLYVPPTLRNAILEDDESDAFDALLAATAARRAAHADHQQLSGGLSSLLEGCIYR